MTMNEGICMVMRSGMRSFSFSKAVHDISIGRVESSDGGIEGALTGLPLGG